ncbi:gluconate transporter [Gilliamella sp. wkB108]|uniref:gluconate:H+ symporter n=1 Tax=Gilliamella sp. wkB108 TaxID=3120256 RepID=UPI00080E220B|nr:gluconate:H+ symporter [Gilliamella apicola]OCG28334.1 gluconate transporter [Gilliamella apicola]
MPLVYVAIGVALLLVLMLRLKIHCFIALILVALFVGLVQGMSILGVLDSIKHGVGGTLSNLALIMGFGAMLGKLLGDSGGAQRIATTLVNKFGEKNIQFAVAITGFIVGFALFFEVGIILLMPLVITLALTLRISLLYVGIPMAAAISVTHCFLPPHPGPTAIANIFNADMGKTLIYGAIISIPTIIISGPLFARLPYIRRMNPEIHMGFANREFKEEEMPGFSISVFTALIPVILMALRAIFEMFMDKSNPVLPYAEFFGDPVIATLIAAIVALYTFGFGRGKTVEEITTSIESSAKLIAMMLLIIGAGGAFKQVLIDSGVKDYIASHMHSFSFSPILLAWLIAVILRLALGSATVTALTTGGIVFPLIEATGVSPELMVLAVGSGSVFFSHVNDPGFWMIKEYFNLSVVETLKSWSILETVISVCGLIGCLLINIVI